MNVLKGCSKKNRQPEHQAGIILEPGPLLLIISASAATGPLESNQELSVSSILSVYAFLVNRSEFPAGTFGSGKPYQTEPIRLSESGGNSFTWDAWFAAYAASADGAEGFLFLN